MERKSKATIQNITNLKIGTMSYLRFEKAVMTNLEESLRRELLRTNRSGAYSASTLVDCNTRKYHGLLVVPVPEIDDENHVLLSSLDCTVVQHGAEFNLGLPSIRATISALRDTSTFVSLMPVWCQPPFIVWGV